MEALWHDEGVGLVSLEGLTLRDLDRFGESAIAAVLESILDAGAAEQEAIAAFSSEDDNG
ncbi:MULTISPECIES: FXSXX-COOH protein [unclassified Nocardiopsis]|uniref:FXSXX-COOH protein n=1 Tax=Nocardiopsis TaxID=2013 RepID=UPI00387AC0FB